MIVDISKNILIVGLGLMGGSYAMALHKYGFHISAITRSKESIEYALGKQMIDEGSVEPDPAMIGKADLVIFALYPHVFVEWIEQYQKYLKSGALLTDVTGVKGCIVDQIQEMLRGDVEFIAAHPMAGREVYGVQNSTPRMFDDANYIVTPTPRNTPDAIETCKELGRLLGFANVSELTPAEHDDMIGFVSQLTHCIAVTLMTCNESQHIEQYTGDSFRDLTRIARINDAMWSELFMLNKPALLKQMNLFSEEFDRLKTMLQTDDVDGMRAMMRKSTLRRELFNRK